MTGAYFACMTSYVFSRTPCCFLGTMVTVKHHKRAIVTCTCTAQNTIESHVFQSTKDLRFLVCDDIPPPTTLGPSDAGDGYNRKILRYCIVHNHSLIECCAAPSARMSTECQHVSYAFVWLWKHSNYQVPVVLQVALCGRCSA